MLTAPSDDRRSPDELGPRHRPARRPGAAPAPARPSPPSRSPPASPPRQARRRRPREHARRRPGQQPVVAAPAGAPATGRAHAGRQPGTAAPVTATRRHASDGNGGGSPVTLYDVARLAGVSTATVSRVVHGLDRVRESTRIRVTRVIEELGYVPDGAAQSLSRRRKDVIGLVCVERRAKQYDIENMNLLYYDEILHGVEARIRDHGSWSLLITFLQEDEANLARLQSLSGKVDGLLIGEGIVLLGPAGPAGPPGAPGGHRRRPGRAVHRRGHGAQPGRLGRAHQPPHRRARRAAAVPRGRPGGRVRRPRAAHRAGHGAARAPGPRGPPTAPS